MILDLIHWEIMDDHNEIKISILGNYFEFGNLSLNNLLSKFPDEIENLFELPLPVTFRQGNGIHLWLDWSESSSLISEKNAFRCFLTLSDRIFQGLTEICRLKNEYSVQIIGGDHFPPNMLQLLTQRIQTQFRVT